MLTVLKESQIYFYQGTKSVNDYVLRRVGIGTIPELHLRKVGILTLSDKVRIPTLSGSIPELSVRKVGIRTK